MKLMGKKWIRWLLFLLVLVLIMGFSFALSIAGGYKLASRIRYWNCLAVPIILVGSFIVFTLIADRILRLI